ncbi:MAG: MarC family protein [Pseudomonadota bacterium]
MASHFFPAFYILLLALNPLAYLHALRTSAEDTSSLGRKNNRLMIAKACSWSLCLLLAISLLGQALATQLSPSLASMQISSGLTLFLLAISMIFPVRRGSAGDPAERGSQGFASMFACTAGPIVLANVLLLSAVQTGHWPEMATALACAVLVSAMLMQLCHRLQHHFGFAMAVSGLQKLTGLILVAVAVDKVLIGTHQYFSA